MSGSLSRLRNLAQGNRSQNQPTLLEFPPLDVDQIASDIELDKRGTERGAAGEPRSGSTTLDRVEKEVVDKVQRSQQAAVEQLTGQLDICSERLRRLQFDSMVINVKSETLATVADFEQEGRNGLNLLFQLRRGLIDATDALEKFKKDYDINRPAHKKVNDLYTILILLLIFLIETLGNGFLIGTAHDSGLIGGYTLAVTFSFINVAAGYSAGRFGLSSAYHKYLPQKIWGMFLVGAYLVGVFFFNFYIAHVRDAMQSGGLEEALNQVWSKVWTLSFDFKDFQAPLILIIGIAFSLIAFYKGFKNDDPYPDYGRQSRLRDETEATYAEQFADLGDQLTGLRNDIKKALQEVAMELGFRRTEYFGIMETINRLISRFTSHERQLESSTQRLLNIYRDANKKARSTGQPKYFESDFKLSESYIPPPNIDSIYPKDKVESLIEEAKDLIHRSIDDVDKAHREAFRRYDLISQVLDKSRLKEIAVEVSEEGGKRDGE